jgi:N6-L-threonylcarbamoyladenine synthase
MKIEDALGGVELPIPTAEEDPVGRKIRADIAASFQTVAVRHLEERCRRALQWAAESHPEMKHVVVAGGVASNTYLRGRLTAVAEEGGLELVCPPPRLCTDNGVMVGWAGVERLKLGLGIEPPPPSVVPVEGEWVDLRPRWPLTDRKDDRSIEAPRSAKKKNIFESLEALTAGQTASM